ncbi:threonine-phosphate decarboxylase CobD [Chitinibacter sp. GC72]|uniref:threonine-phosphate decarboxylase CobD n=1 Tax=Chitinibacter sp. GC72 TaxID=1526917 RepID=UPI0012F7D3C2|nr:threonine-phosphate decarboxylase CobD [Chitinibacter sp. GC72]
MHSAPRHGGNLRTLMANFGGTLADWIDCSTGIAPYSYPLPNLPVNVVQRLPHPTAEFEQVVAHYYGSRVFLPVAGSQAAIAALPTLRSAGKVGVLRASYAEHSWRWQLAGHTVVSLNPNEVEYAAQHLDVLVLVNPNNPDGLIWSRETLLALHQTLAARGGWLIVDEAFIDAIDGDCDGVGAQSLCADAEREGLIVLRSVGKFFGLAGVRLGFVFAHAALRERLVQQIGPWNVSGPALWAGQLALADHSWQAAQRARLAADAAWLAALLTEVGLPPSGSHPLMQFCPVQAIDQWGYALASNRIYARPFNTLDIGLDAIRFGALAVEQRATFAQRLRLAASQVV